jgi:peptidoglycan hydrolase-like protein with peptidoglycan-binding domain
MSRSVWAAAGASALAFALTPGVAMAAVGGRSAARPAGVHAKQDEHPRRRASTRLGQAAARASARRQVPVLLVPGSGYDQQRGSSRVRTLQRRLAGLGFAPGPIDGRYGPLTAQAVDSFQGAVGLTIDAIAGPRTLGALSATPSDALLPGAGYQQPAGSGRVRALQRRLARLGFAAGPVDGRYGPLTTEAVDRFQHSRGLLMDGIVGAHTLAALRAQGGVRPISAERRRRHLGPRRHTGPPPASARARPQRKRILALPLTPVLLAFVALGLAMMSLSYARTRSRISRARAAARLKRGPTAEPIAAVTTEPVGTRNPDGRPNFRERAR